MCSDHDSLDYNDLNDEDVEEYLEYFWGDDEIPDEGEELKGKMF